MFVNVRVLRVMGYSERKGGGVCIDGYISVRDFGFFYRDRGEIGYRLNLVNI